MARRKTQATDVPDVPASAPEKPAPKPARPLAIVLLADHAELGRRGLVVRTEAAKAEALIADARARPATPRDRALANL